MSLLLWGWASAGSARMFHGGKQRPWTQGLLKLDLPWVSSLLPCPGTSVEPPHRCGNALPLLHQDLAPALARNEVG